MVTKQCNVQYGTEFDAKRNAYIRVIFCDLKTKTILYKGSRVFVVLLSSASVFDWICLESKMYC